MSFKYNSSGIKDEFPTLPEGWYDFKIIEAEEGTSKKNGYDMILAKCQVINNPDYADFSPLWHYVVFPDPTANWAWINVAFRKAIGVPHGGDDVVDADDWTGKRFKGYVIVEEGDDGVKRNKIQKVSPLKDSSAAKEAAMAAQAPSKKVNKDEDIPF